MGSHENYIHPTDKTDEEPTQEQFEAVYTQIQDYIQRKKLRGTAYSDDIPEGDEPALRYKIFIPDEAMGLFAPSDEIRQLHPKDPQIDYITPHRFDRDQAPWALIRFSYTFDRDKTVNFNLYGEVSSEGSIVWHGDYDQEESEDWSVDTVERPLVQRDLVRLGAVTGVATTWLNR